MEQNKQQTAVDWLYNQIKIASPKTNVINTDHLFFYRFYQQAKQMEKKQIIDAVDAWVANGNLKGEQYYNETYGGNK